MLMNKQKKTQITNNNKRRLLISINVMGSAGPIRFVVNEEELVAAVIETTLKSYAREGRLPVLGSDNNAFCLYCPLLGSAGIHFSFNCTISMLFITHLLFIKMKDKTNSYYI